MSKERDEYVRRLVEKAERERGAKPGSGSALVSGGQNGRQQVEPSGAERKAVRRGPAPVKRTSSPSRPSDRSTSQRPAPPERTSPPVRRAKPVDNQVVENPVRDRQEATSPKKVSPKKSPAHKDSQSEAHIWFSLALIFVSLFLAMSVVAYLLYWQTDEKLAYFHYLFDLKATGAENWGGKLGAIVGNLCVGRTFGLMGLGFPILVMVGAVKALRIKNLTMHKSMRSILTVMFLGSVALGHFTGYDPLVFGSGYGGEMGVYVAEWLHVVIGSQGTTLMIVIVGLAILYYVNSGWIRSLVGWINELMERGELQRSLRALQQRERDIAASEMAVRLKAELDEREALLRSERAEAIKVAAANIASPVVQLVAQAPNGEQKEEDRPSLEKESTPDVAEVSKENNTESTIKNGESTVDKTMLLPLEGPQWGYIIDWEVSGAPIYLYLDRAAVALIPPVGEAKSKLPSILSKLASGIDSRDNDDIEEHEIEFVIKNFSNAKATDEEFSIQEARPNYTLQVHSTLDDLVVDAPNDIPTDTSKSVKMEVLKTEPDAQKEVKTVRFAPSPDDPNFIVEQSVGDELLDDRMINLTELYDPTRELASYKKPPVELLKDHSHRVNVSQEELVENKNRIVHTLETFGIKIDTIEATIGPTVTLYEIIPAPGVRISKIKNLEDDIALSLSALGIRIIAPIPGRGTIGIEVPNKDKETVSMYSVIKSAKFQESKFDLPIALGKTIQNETFVIDLAKMPHLLVAGATGQGKSVGLNAIITSLLYKKHPSQLKFILVDPKKVELTLYAKLEKHFLAKMPAEEDAIITDTQKVIYTLNSICVEMDARYDLLKAAKVRNVSEYNDKFIHRRLNPEKGHRFLPYFVVIIDEFADLIMTAGREVETPIARIAQLARAVGIHLIIATQRPTTNIITGVIKANFPARIAFRVTSMIDSRTILDSPGANQLVGRGDMLVSTGSEVTRVQCAFIDTPEVDDITEFIGSQRGYVTAYELPEYVPEGKDNGLTRDVDTSKRDPLFEEVARFVVANQSGSASTIQRKYSIGFNRAGRLIDQLEAAGIVGGADGSKARQVLVQDPLSLEMLLDN